MVDDDKCYREKLSNEGGHGVGGVEVGMERLQQDGQGKLHRGDTRLKT